MGIAIVLVTGSQSIVLGDRPVESWSNVGALDRVGDGLVSVGDRSGIDRIDRGQFVDVAPIDVDEERGFLVDRTADIPAELRRVVRRLRAGEGVGSVEGRIVSIRHDLTVELIRAGFGEDFDAAITEVVVFGRKRILVDANFANGGLRRKLAGR